MGYSDHLKHGGKAASMDNTTFLSWERGDITTYECFEQYCNNNDIDQAPLYQKDLFEHWLNSLGYRRSAYVED